MKTITSEELAKRKEDHRLKLQLIEDMRRVKEYEQRICPHLEWECVDRYRNFDIGAGEWLDTYKIKLKCRACSYVTYEESEIIGKEFIPGKDGFISKLKKWLGL